MFRVLKVQIIFCSHFTLKRCHPPTALLYPNQRRSPSGHRLSLNASPTPRRRPGFLYFFNVPDYLMSFWNAWIIVGGYSSVIGGHRALIGQRLSPFWPPWLCRGDSFKPEWEREKILLLQAWQATRTNFELDLRHKTTPPLLFGSCTHALHAGVSPPHQIHSDEAKCGCFRSFQMWHKMSCVSVRGLKPPPGRRAISSSSQEQMRFSLN